MPLLPTITLTTSMQVSTNTQLVHTSSPIIIVTTGDSPTTGIIIISATIGGILLVFLIVK